MSRIRVETIYHLRCADCASAYRNFARAKWRLHRSIEVHIGFLPAAVPHAAIHDLDFEVHCLVQHMRPVGRQQELMQLLVDSLVDRTKMISSREDVWHLATQVGVEPPAAPFIVYGSAPAVHQALQRTTEINPIRVPAFLIDEEHLLHGNASPSFIHDVLQTLAKPQNTTEVPPSVRPQWTS